MSRGIGGMLDGPRKSESPHAYTLRFNTPMKIALLVLAATCVRAADTEWPVNGGPYNIRYSTLTQINPANVNKLQIAWIYDAHDAFKDSEMQSNPIIVDGLL